MSMLSREIASWLQSSPGAIIGPDSENVWLQAKMKFMADRRWREEFDVATFMLHLNSLGYRLEPRTNHSGGKQEHICMLALPSRHRGF
jgi:hypothetical protein